MVEWEPNYATPPRDVQGWVPRDELPISDLPAPTDDTAHRFLLRERVTTATYHPVEVMGLVRETVEALPEYQATFTVGEVTEQFDVANSSIQPPMLLMLGAWPGSTRFMNDNNGSRRTRWVNPNYVHKARYSDVIVRCACGTLLVHDQSAGSRAPSLPHDGYDDHADDCIVSDRWRARADLYDNRRRVMREMFRMGHDGTDIYPRLGLADQGTITHLTERLDLVAQNEKDVFYDLRRRTILELAAMFDYHTIGAAYGVSADTVRTEIRKAGYDVRDFHDVRRKNQATRERCPTIDDLGEVIADD